MKSPEFIAHGTSSMNDAEKIREEGFVVEEGRANVSGDLIYAFEWATNHDRRRGSKSTSLIDENEKGRIIIMKVPEDKSVDYAKHTDINIDEAEREISGYPSKYVSGRRQLAIYNQDSLLEEIAESEVSKDNKIGVSEKNILMSIVPTEELGKKLGEISQEIRNLHNIDFVKFSREIVEIINANGENFFASDLDIMNIVQELLVSTVETEVVNMIRSLSLNVKVAQGYKVYNRGKEQLKSKDVERKKLRDKLESIRLLVESPHFNIGLENLNRYIRTNINKLLSLLEE